MSKRDHYGRNQAAIPLILKALILSAQWAGTVRIRQMWNLAGEKNYLENKFQLLRDRIFQLETDLEFCRKNINGTNLKSRYTLRERLLILWYKEYFSSIDTRNHETA